MNSNSTVKLSWVWISFLILLPFSSLAEDAAVHIIAPYQVDLCEDYGTVIEENVKLKKRPEPGNNWPFPFPKDSEQGG